MHSHGGISWNLKGRLLFHKDTPHSVGDLIPLKQIDLILLTWEGHKRWASGGTKRHIGYGAAR